MANLEKLINQLRVKVSEYFKEDASGHSIDHLERTLKYALHLQSIEGGDKIVIGVAAFIHDVHRILETKQKRYVTAKESLSVVETLIQDLPITKKQKEHILFAVEHHEKYSAENAGVKITDIETQILQDADNLDGIGAMGIVRTFKHGKAHNRPDYDANVSLDQDNYDEYKNDISTIHFIYNRLLHFGDGMNTATAKKIAKEKTTLMKNFIDVYVKEYGGYFEI